MTIDDFVAHPSARQSLLTKAHVVALRLYTTAAFRSINDPLRDRDRYDHKLPHKLPVTVALLRDALGKLRAVEANQGSKDGGADKGGFASPRVSPRELHLYRGMKDVRAPLEFLAQGGTELAPMSTTSSLAVAMKYSASRNAVLLRLVTDSFISATIGSNTSTCARTGTPFRHPSTNNDSQHDNCSSQLNALSEPQI